MLVRGPALRPCPSRAAAGAAAAAQRASWRHTPVRPSCPPGCPSRVCRPRRRSSCSALRRALLSPEVFTRAQVIESVSHPGYGRGHKVPNADPMTTKGEDDGFERIRTREFGYIYIRLESSGYLSTPSGFVCNENHLVTTAFTFLVHVLRYCLRSLVTNLVIFL